MRNLIFFCFLLLSLPACVAQETITVRYISSQYNRTKNNSFICKEMRFISYKNNDTLSMNVRLPLKVTVKVSNDTIGIDVVDMGIYYDCHLKKDTIYTITVKKICINEIPEVYHSYYNTNAIFDNNDCSKFTEIEKNTPYEYIGYYGKFVDIKGILYEIVGLKPDNDCFYP